MKNSARVRELFPPKTLRLLHKCRFETLLLNVVDTLRWSSKSFLPRFNAGEMPGTTFHWQRDTGDKLYFLSTNRNVGVLFLHLSTKSHAATVQQTPKSISALALLGRFNFGLFTPRTLKNRKAILSALLLTPDINFQPSRLINIKKLSFNVTQCGA